MSDVTLILHQIEGGDPSAAEKLLPLVYAELRKLAAARMSAESSDHTLQATALVHEAYVRLVDGQESLHWNSRGHFFGAAAEAMRRILVDSARRRYAQKRGAPTEIAPDAPYLPDVPLSLDDMLDFDDALLRLEALDREAAQLVSRRVFAGLTVEEAAASLGIPDRTAYRSWAFAKAWLFRELNRDAD